MRPGEPYSRRFRWTRAAPKPTMFSAMRCLLSASGTRRSSPIGGHWQSGLDTRRHTTISEAHCARWGASTRRRPSCVAPSSCGGDTPRRSPISDWCCRSRAATAKPSTCSTGQWPAIPRTRPPAATARCCCCFSAVCARASPSTSGAGACPGSPRRAASLRSRCGTAPRLPGARCSCTPSRDWARRSSSCAMPGWLQRWAGACWSNADGRCTDCSPTLSRGRAARSPASSPRVRTCRRSTATRR